MTKTNKALLALALIAGSLVSLGQSAPRGWYYVRAYMPFPINYVARLHMMELNDGMNCSGYISNAHSIPFRTSWEFYANTYQDLTLVGTAKDYAHIDESQLQPGDLAAFAGAPGISKSGNKGVHVAAYLGGGQWIDANVHIGFILHYRMGQEGRTPATDPYYDGDVRLYRFNQPARFHLLAAEKAIGKDDSNN